VFLPALQNQFVDWDDDVTLVDNPEFRGLRWTNLRWMFTTTLMGHWIPLTWITFGADYLVWGMRPLGYHLTSVLLHTAGAVVFYFVALRLLRTATGAGEVALRLGALAAALFFAIHPLRVESVAWATERRDVLSGLLFLLTILTYLEAAAGGRRRRWWLAGSVACYALATTSKAIVMTLPAVLILLDVYPLRRLGPRWREWTVPEARRIWAEKIPYLLLALGAAGVAGYAQRSLAEPLAARPVESRIAVAFYGLGFYLWKTLVPFPISPLYQIPPRVDPLAVPMVASALAVVALTGGLLWLRRKWPAGLAAWVSYVVLLAPVSGITQSGPQLVAARYSYLSGLGWALLAGGAVCLLAHGAPSGRLSRRWARLGAAAIFACCVGLGILSWEQTRIWHDSETLWSYVVSVDPASSIAHNNLGFVLLNQGRLDAAEREIREALRLSPEWEQARSNLATSLARQGRFEEAGEARAQLGYLLLKHGKFTAAIELFRKEVSARPRDPAAHNNLGAALLLQGDVGPAIEQFEQALDIDPGHERARRNLAAARQRR
jgi:tetratricopeptide (TPR) repeat protein